MGRGIEESDWKMFRQLYDIALERFCQRVIEEIQATTADCSGDYHDCYLKLFKLMKRRDKELARCFDDMRRSNATLLLVNINYLGLLTDEELAQFSEETRDAIKPIDSRR